MTTIIFFVVLSVLILIHEFGHFIMARKVGVRVERFSLGFGPRLLSLKRKDTEYTLCAIPLGGYVKLAGDSPDEYKGNRDEYFSRSPWERFKIVFFGPLLNYALGIVCFWFIFCVGYPKLTTKIGGTIDGFGAQKAGIVEGDRIVAIDGVKVEYWEELQKIIQTRQADAAVAIQLQRGTQELSLEVPIQEKTVDDVLGKKHKVGLLGIVPSEETVTVRHNILESAYLGLQKSWDLTTLTYQAIWRMISGQLSVKESVTGPLGMFYITQKVASLGFIALLHFLATLTISLAIFNLLPIPALDGGHLVLLLIEKIRGKGLQVKTERIMQQVGFSLIIFLALIVTYNDILRLFGEKIAKFFNK
jgi:regulator of sigma E protease